MKKSAILLVLLLVLTAGCQSLFAEKMVLLDEPIAEVNVSKSLGFGEINEEALLNFNDEEAIKAFEKAITSAEKAGKDNLSKPEYDLIISYGEGFPSHAIYLWLGEEDEQSTMMYLADEETVYVTSAKTTNKLRGLILSE